MKENSIEEDIKNAEHFIKSIKKDKEYKEENGWHGYYNKEIVELARILQHILSDYKRVLKENEELGKFITEGIEIKTNSPYKNYSLEFLRNNFIQIQKVKDKIEYLDNQQKQWLEDRELKENDSEIIFARDILKELLESEE